MKAASISIWLPLCLGLVSACGDPGLATPDTSGSEIPITITITVTSDRPPALVAFRDGAGGWKAATMRTPTTFEAEVHGPYVVAIACEDPALGEALTAQLARTPEDARDLTQACTFAPRYTVTGHMVQVGRVQLGGSESTSTSADWDFSLRPRAGTHDLIAATSERMVLRRGISVTGDTVVTPAIDAAQQGTPLTGVAFTATNASPNELLSAHVDLDTPRTTRLGVYRGSIAMAKVAPDSALSVADEQTAMVQGIDGRMIRSLRRPFRVGGNTVFTLPALLTGVQWEVANGNLGVSWGSVPTFDTLLVVANTASAQLPLKRSVLDISRSFLDATGAARASFDLDLPGYQAAWGVDLTTPYFRQLVVRRTAGGEIATSSTGTELVSQP